MANCNCNDFPISCAPHAPGGDCYHPHGCPPHPCPPPKYKPGTSMYIGARYVPIFADPVEWDDEREYEPLTIVIHDGSCYTSKCYVPKGAQLPPYPEGQTKYWVKTSDYNYQFADLKKTVLDLSRLVEQFQKDNKAFTDLINSWNEKVERLDTVESNITDLTASLNAEIDRAKAAEQANAAAIAQETADRQQAISELDAAYKAADAAEAQAREAGDAANAAAIAKEITDRQQAISELDAAYKAADAAEAQARADADTALNNRISANKTDIDALKAEQAIQNTNISKNAKNISDNAEEIAKHATRLSSLESNASDWDDVFPDTTIAQEVQKEELARANADTALNGRCDTIAADVEEVRDIANHKVDTTTYTEGQAAQDTKINAAQAAANKANTNIGDWETDHPGQTISQCATSLENETAANAAKADANAAVIGDWNAEHPGQTIAQEVTRLNGAIPDVSGFVTETTYNQGQAAQDTKINAAQSAANKANTSIGDWDAQHPGKTIAQAVTDVSSAIPDVSGFVTETTYNQGQAAQDTVISGKADKKASFTAVVYPHFMCAKNYVLKPTSGLVTPEFSLKAVINNPYITRTSKVTIDTSIWYASVNAFGFTPGDIFAGGETGNEIAYNVTPYPNTRQRINLTANRPTVTVNDGNIVIDFTNVVFIQLTSEIEVHNVAFNVYTDPITVTVTI